MPKYQEEPVRGTSEHLIETTLRDYRHELDKISDPKVRSATTDAMVQRMKSFDKQHDTIADDFVPRIRELEARRDPLPKTDPRRAPLEKQLVTIDRQWERRLAPLLKALHKDLDKIVNSAVSPYRDRERALLKNVQSVGKNLRARELADAFRARQRQQRPGKDRDHER